MIVIIRERVSPSDTVFRQAKYQNALKAKVQNFSQADLRYCISVHSVQILFSAFQFCMCILSKTDMESANSSWESQLATATWTIIRHTKQTYSDLVIWPQFSFWEDF